MTLEEMVRSENKNAQRNDLVFFTVNGDYYFTDALPNLCHIIW